MLSFPTAEDKSSVLKEKPTSVFGLSIESGANHEVEKSDVLPLPGECDVATASVHVFIQYLPR